MFSFTGTSACKKTLAMHGCEAQFIDFFLKLNNYRYKVAVSTIFSALAFPQFDNLTIHTVIKNKVGEFKLHFTAAES